MLRTILPLATLFFATGLFAQGSTEKLKGSSDKAHDVYQYQVRREEVRQPADSVYDAAQVDQQPEFPGGKKALFQCVTSHVHFPDAQKSSGDGAKVYVRFVVGTNGGVQNVVIARGAAKEFNEEALRVVRAMPAWKPGMKAGKAVPVRMVLPIVFAPN